MIFFKPNKNVTLEVWFVNMLEPSNWNREETAQKMYCMSTAAPKCADNLFVKINPPPPPLIMNQHIAAESFGYTVYSMCVVVL